MPRRAAVAFVVAGGAIIQRGRLRARPVCRLNASHLQVKDAPAYFGGVFRQGRRGRPAILMAKGMIKIGDEVMVRATVTAIWKDGHVTVQVKSAGQKVTLPNNSDIEQTNQLEPARPKRKGERLLYK